MQEMQTLLLQKDKCQQRFLAPTSQAGAAMLIMSIVLMTLSTLIIIFAANYSLMQNKSITNLQRAAQAFNAAQAGLEFGISYLKQNANIILIGNLSGNINPYSDSNTSNVTLANSSKYTITYSNPTPFNYNVIKISSTGTSDDGTSTQTVSQLTSYGSLLLNPPTKPVVSLGSVTLNNSVMVTNNNYNTTLQTGGSVTINNLASTLNSSGVSSNSGNMNNDISQNDTALSSLSSSNFFSSLFGLSPSFTPKVVSTYLSSDKDKDYSSTLNGLQGTSIWIDQNNGTATISGTTTIGSSTNPVLLIIKGNSNITQNVVIYGFVYLDNPSTAQINSSAILIGGVATTGGLAISNTARVFYSSSVLSNLQNAASMKYYAKIPGSWKDF
jgi:Tfp pilus assembly protein PilX